MARAAGGAAGGGASSCAWRNCSTSFRKAATSVALVAGETGFMSTPSSLSSVNSSIGGQTPAGPRSQ
eukprot:1687390-Lingulodinium_polyedra.AAC.1